jgi:hypothetical protein
VQGAAGVPLAELPLPGRHSVRAGAAEVAQAEAMSKQLYISRSFTAGSLELVFTMNKIIAEYVEQGFRLTARQLYYQLVARGRVENTEQSYKRVCSIVNDAKLAGMMDWEAIEDRTREFIRRTRWESPSAILRAVADQYHEDLWEGQPVRPFVIVEKEALAGVLEGVCRELDTPLLAARGYPSGTVLREFAVSDVHQARDADQGALIIHLGDHDPSGIDMTRDLRSRLELFGEDSNLELVRIALNMNQIREQRPPPNPAKTTDSRFATYQAEHGTESWELDALSPTYLAGIVRDAITRCIKDKAAWKARGDKVKAERAKLLKVAGAWK